MRACSACAGEYEDPDRTAWTLEESEEEEPGTLETGGDGEEFPAVK